mmetsp:Transcript_39860/g.120686  ORF Transcript_39860/g.120686 Transcript_39860/m.120686 type:complete len:208 (-) Transcript_39860:145-768(-)
MAEEAHGALSDPAQYQLDGKEDAEEILHNLEARRHGVRKVRRSILDLDAHGHGAADDQRGHGLLEEAAPHHGLQEAWPVQRFGAVLPEEVLPAVPLGNFGGHLPPPLPGHLLALGARGRGARERSLHALAEAPAARRGGAGGGHAGGRQRGGGGVAANARGGAPFRRPGAQRVIRQPRPRSVGHWLQRRRRARARHGGGRRQAVGVL